MPSVFSFPRRVEFCETDAAGIAHFSSLIIYMEQSEHALLRSVGLSVAAAKSSSAATEVAYSWPRVKVECEFCSPARFEDLIVVQTTIAALGSKSATYRHQLSVGSTTIAIGKMTSVCCVREGNSFSGTNIPIFIRELLQPFCVQSDLSTPG